MFGGEDEYEYDEKRPIVMDNGAGYIKMDSHNIMMIHQS